ncbi:MAG: hypothetical protein WA705_24405 [Candidatus Ozemobacteraceae bacterium]
MVDPKNVGNVHFVQLSELCYGWYNFPRYKETATLLVSGNLVACCPKNGVSALGLQRILGLGSYQTAWSWLHKFRRLLVIPGREKLSGKMEIDDYPFACHPFWKLNSGSGQ